MGSERRFIDNYHQRSVWDKKFEYDFDSSVVWKDIAPGD
jgi:hypothetical protein